jgi:hypothetical protein
MRLLLLLLRLMQLLLLDEKCGKKECDFTKKYFLVETFTIKYMYLNETATPPIK